MAYLRSARSGQPAPPSATTEHPCLEPFDRELDYIFTTLRRLGAKPTELEDLAQEIFVVLHKNWSTLDTTRPLRPYLFGVAFRVFYAHRRRRQREIPFGVVEIEDGAPSPEGSLHRKESVALLLAALERVPLRRRAVVVMHELDDVPVLEVARRLSMSQFGTYARLRKGRAELQVAVRRLSRGERAK
jgi:RNA polymerase sigma-70 factor, ECF subfamily